MEEAAQGFAPMMNHMFVMLGDPYCPRLKKGKRTSRLVARLDRVTCPLLAPLLLLRQIQIHAYSSLRI
jgi:hypothetical protein